MYVMRRRKNEKVSPEEANRRQAEALAGVSVEELRKRGVTLFRYTPCPYCGKVKAFLDRFSIPYVCVEVDPMMKSQLPEEAGGYAKVPVLQVGMPGDNAGGAAIVDSFEIVSVLAPRLSGSQDSEDVMRWRRWAAGDGAGEGAQVRYLTLNVNRSIREAWQALCYVDACPSIPWASRMLTKVSGSIIMYLVVQHFATRKKLMKHNGYDGGEERAALYKELSKWVVDGLSGRPFHGGTSPDSADTDVYGVLDSFWGRPVYVDVLKEADPGFVAWVHRMDKALGRKPLDVSYYTPVHEVSVKKPANPLPFGPPVPKEHAKDWLSHRTAGAR